MPMTPHDTYYEKVKEHAHDDMARVTGKPKVVGQDELLCNLAYALKHGTCEEAAEAIRAFVDGRVAHHELNENNA